LRKILLLSLGIAGFLYSCVSTKPPVFHPEETSPQQIYSRLDRQFRTVTNFQGDATLAIDTPEQSGQVSSEISANPGKDAEIILKSPFGGKVGRLVIRRRYLMFYNAEDRLQFIGSPDNTGIPALPEIFSGQQDLPTIITGMLNLPANPNQSVASDSMDGDLYWLRFESDSTTTDYWYDPQVAMLSRYQEVEKFTGKKTTIEFDKFTEINGMQLPRSIKIIQPEERRMLAIYYHSINISRDQSADAL